MNPEVLLSSIFIFLSFVIYLTRTEVHVTNVDMRPPKSNDIGLIFDVNLINTADLNKGGYEIKIRCEECCIALPYNKTMCDAVKMIGGFFGYLNPGVSKRVSIIWPTVTLYNRVGSCDMVVISHNNASDVRARISHTVKFDTSLTAENIPDIMKEFVYGLNITDCPTLDLNPFQKCKPINCEQKYFGKRSFFNNTNNLCEPVPNCTGKGVIYDFIINECIDGKHPICMEDIKEINAGKYDNNDWKFNKYIPSWNQDYYGYPDEAKETAQKTKRQIFSPWKSVINAFLIIAVAVACFLGICFFIYILGCSIRKIRERKEKKSEGNKK